MFIARIINQLITQLLLNIPKFKKKIHKMTDLRPLGARGVDVQGAERIRLGEHVHIHEVLTGDGQFNLTG